MAKKRSGNHYTHNQVVRYRVQEMAKHGITIQDLEYARKEGRMEAIMAESTKYVDATVTIAFASVGMAFKRLGVGQKTIVDALKQAYDELMFATDGCSTSDEYLDKLKAECGIELNIGEMSADEAIIVEEVQDDVD